jgi:ABC-type lipoprotein export system ATPase subunit
MAPVSSPATYPIEACDLTLTKGDYIVLNNVSLALQKGTFAALIGPSGCGKTSLLRVLSLLDQPTRGVVHFWGNEAKKKNGTIWLAAGTPLYPRISFVPQTLALWPHLTIRENMLFATNESSQVCSKLNSLSAELQMSAILNRKPAYVSQGQRQRCALVRALLLTPSVLLLDEITSALDENLARDVWSLLRSFANEGGTILASTHSGRLASSCDYCYRIRDKSLCIEPPLREITPS